MQDVRKGVRKGARWKKRRKKGINSSIRLQATAKRRRARHPHRPRMEGGDGNASGPEVHGQIFHHHVCGSLAHAVPVLQPPPCSVTVAALTVALTVALTATSTAALTAALVLSKHTVSLSQRPYPPGRTGSLPPYNFPMVT